MSKEVLGKNNETLDAQQSKQITRISVLLCRILWTFLGPMILLLVAFKIGTHRGWFTPWDATFGILVLLMLGGRWIEQRSGEATTMTGEPSSAGDFHRYELILLIVSAIIWLVANILSNHILIAGR